MRVLYRLLLPSSGVEDTANGGRARPPGHSDVAVELTPTATVADVAAALAAHLHEPTGGGRPRDEPAGDERTGRRRTGRITVVDVRDDAPAPDPDAPALAALPRAGSTVRLSAPSPGAAAAPPSPVRLTAPDGSSTTLPYGTSSVPPDGPRAAVVEVRDHVRLLADGPAELVVDGARVHGATVLRPGSVVGVGPLTYVVGIDGPLDPPRRAGPTAAANPVREVRHRHEPISVELPPAPAEVRPPSFPVLSAGVPVVLGVGLWLLTRSVAMAGFVLFSVAFVVASALEVRREARLERRFRESEFRQDLAEAAEQLAELRAAEQRRAALEHPAAAEVVGWATDGGPRRWERTSERPGRLAVRLGTHRRRPADAAVVREGGRRDLRAAVRAVAEEHSLVTLPAVVDLDEAVGLAVVGGGEPAAALARSVLLQLATLVGPDDLSVELRCAPHRRPAWSWLAWLPHAAGHRCDRHLVVVDAGDGAAPPGAADGSEGTRWLWLADDDAGLPDVVGATVDAVRRGAAGLRRGDGPSEPVTAEVLTLEEAEPAARGLAGVRPGRKGRPGPGRHRHSAADDAGPLRLDQLAGEASVDGVLARWDDAGPLRCPLGRAGGGALWMDLERDGPHGLVAGTTGSGKSEALRTLLASLALHHPPERVAFLLVDYKGGAAFGPLTDLPHTVGVVTDLTPDLARRAVTSLRAELLDREAALRDAGVSDLRELRALDPEGAPPSLVLVVDEFATLARELPDLLDGFVDVAQRGRSLGIHLVLATQRPAGVVTDAIRANTGYRLALRTSDGAESTDVVDVPDAASLPRDQPGRALLRLGPGDVVDLRLAWTGGPSTPPPPARVLGLDAVLDAREHPAHDRLGSVAGAAVADPAAPTQLEAVVAAVADAAARRGRPAPDAPWQPPLPARLLAPAGWTGDGAGCRLGLLDLPEDRVQPPWQLDLRAAGGLAVLGAPRSGTTTALRSLASLLGPTGAVDTWVVDGGAGRPPSVGGPAAPVAAVPVHDVAATLRLLRALVDEVARRRRGHRTGTAPDRPQLLVVDGVGDLERTHERVNRGEALDLLVRIAATGPQVGVHLAVAARSRGELGPALLAHLGHRLVLRCASEDDAAMVGGPPGLADPDLPAGRGVVVAGPGVGAWVQVALPPAPMCDGRPGPSSPPVPDLPDLVRHEVLAVPTGSPWRLPIGVADHWRLGDPVLPPAVLDLDHGPAVVAGPPRSGRSSALWAIGAAAHHAGLGRRVLLQARAPIGPGGDAEAAWTSVVTADGADPDQLDLGPLRAEGDEPTLVAVDDLPALLDGPHGAAVEAALVELLDRGRAGPVRVVAAGEAEALSHCFHDVVRRLRSARTGLLLRPDPDLHGVLLHTVLPSHDELVPAPGRGWLVDPTGAHPVQLALQTT